MHLSSKNPCTILEGRYISPQEPQTPGWHRLCLLHFVPCTASAPALYTAGAQHRPPRAAAVAEIPSAPFLSQPSGGSQVPGRGWCGLHLCHGCAPRRCARKGVSWSLGLQGASLSPGAWGDSPWNCLWGPVWLLPQLSALRLEARAASGPPATLPMDSGMMGGMIPIPPPGGGGWSPQPICRAVYNTHVSQEAWLAFSGLFVLLIFISVYFLHFKKMHSLYFYNWAKTQNESFHILELKPP